MNDGRAIIAASAYASGSWPGHRVKTAATLLLAVGCMLFYWLQHGAELSKQRMFALTASFFDPGLSRSLRCLP